MGSRHEHCFRSVLYDRLYRASLTILCLDIPMDDPLPTMRSFLARQASERHNMCDARYTLEQDPKPTGRQEGIHLMFLILLFVLLCSLDMSGPKFVEFPNVAVLHIYADHFYRSKDGVCSMSDNT